MTVRVRNLQSAPGTITNFSDNFSSVSTFADNWSMFAWRTSNDGNNRFLWTISGGELITQNDGGGNGQMQGGYFPNVLSGIRNNNQFSQATVTSNNNGPGFILKGPSVFMAPSPLGSYTMTMYAALADFLNNAFYIQRILIGTSLNVPTNSVTIATSLTAPVLGDVIRIEARGVNSGQIDLTVLRNGSTLMTVSDTDANRPRNGIPGMGFLFVSTPPALQGWSNFSAGIL